VLRIDKGGYLKRTDVNVDITPFLPAFLFEVCELQDGVTFRDICLLLHPHQMFLSIMFQGLSIMLEEAFTVFHNDDAREDLTYLELWWDVEYHKGRLTGNDVPSFHGVDVEATGEMPYSLILDNPALLLDLPVKLGPIQLSDSQTMAEDGLANYTFPEPDYTLGNIIAGVVEELTFFGSPQAREQAKAEMNEKVERITKQ